MSGRPSQRPGPHGGRGGPGSLPGAAAGAGSAVGGAAAAGGSGAGGGTHGPATSARGGAPGGAPPPKRQGRPKTPASSRAKPAGAAARASGPNAGSKRARLTPTSASSRGEPEPKRQKPISGAAAAAVMAANARNAAAAAAAAAGGTAGAGVPPPQSPSLSARSRQRKSNTKASQAALAAGASGIGTAQSAIAAAAGGFAGSAGGGQAGMFGSAGHASHVNHQSGSGAAASGGAVGSAQRRIYRTQTPNRSNPPPPPAASLVTIGGIPMPVNVKPTTLSRRYFGDEIQSLMHSFGEVRHGARDVLELMEDVVRERVRKVALDAADRIVDIAEREGVSPLMNKSRLVLTMSHVVYVLRTNPRAMLRLNRHLDSVSGKPSDRTSADRATARRSRPAETAVELARELATIPGVTDARDYAGNAASQVWAERLNANQDIFLACSFRALCAFQKPIVWSKQQVNDFILCRTTSFVKQESKSRAPAVRGKARLALFREWLDIGSKENIYIPDESLHALGQVAWETVGTLTQMALLQRHYDDVASGNCDPGAADWTIGRHVLAALGYGLAQAVMIPLSEAQAFMLHDELIKLDRIGSLTPTGSAAWRGFAKPSSPCLLPCHIREAMRRLDKTPDAPWGYSAS